jgi:hypothetical protein
MKLLTEMSLNKDKILIIIPRDEHIIHIEKIKGTAMEGSVSEKSKIRLTINKSSSSNNQGEALNLSMRGLLATIERTTETTNMAIKNRIARRWVHLDLFKNSPWRKAFFTSCWEMTHRRTETIIIRMWAVILWATGAKVSS